MFIVGDLNTKIKDLEVERANSVTFEQLINEDKKANCLKVESRTKTIDTIELDKTVQGTNDPNDNNQNAWVKNTEETNAIPSEVIDTSHQLVAPSKGNQVDPKPTFQRILFLAHSSFAGVIV